MIDFQREDAALRAAAGLGPEDVLARLGEAYPARHARIRARYEALVSRAVPLSDSERLERDRLDSLVQELYGPRGLLQRAAALMTLEDRLRTVVELAPRCGTSAEVAGRLRREALILRTFGREQTARSGGPATTALASALSAVAHAVGRMHAFCLEASGVDAQRGAHRKARTLRAAAFVADDWPQEKTVGDAVAFILERLSESSLVSAAESSYDALCDAHAAALREELWDAAEGGYARRDAPATLRDVTELDLTLELLCGKLTDRRLDSAERRDAIGALYGLVASARATDAATLAREALYPISNVIRDGISAEAGPP